MHVAVAEYGRQTTIAPVPEERAVSVALERFLPSGPNTGPLRWGAPPEVGRLWPLGTTYPGP
ncbi:hypothetical protein GCM10007147_13270 [Nocardiopsis kunsanensis]|uniref:Uncharacterized protein n=1 Tax=Nocardiopsis kunsanensis TaxID=141693 RepID=A0A918XAY5_9ACTN|nr:hypothetical protein GCM10007147_13270 [Nocardiopsis kunsanensis]